MKRARSVERNISLARAALDRSVENVIGTGIRPQARTESEGFNRRVEELFAERAADCDVREMDDFYGLQAHAYRGCKRDGDNLTIMTGDGRLQVVESDLIRAPFGQRDTPNHVDGIDLDSRGKPLRYHIVNDRELDFFGQIEATADRQVVDADNALFLAERSSASQTRGVSALCTSFELLEHSDGLIEAVVVAARMSACFGLVLQTPNPPGASHPTVEGSDGRQREEWRLEPGMTRRLDPGEELQQIAPEQPGTNFSEFLVLLARHLGIPLGLPLEIMLMDFSRTNYSSARSSLIQAYRSFRKAQQYFINRWCRPIWRRWVAEWIEDGLLSARPDAFNHTWISPGWQWVDPLKEAQAEALRIDLGLASKRSTSRARGEDWDQIAQERADEIKVERELGLPERYGTNTQPAMARPGIFD